MSAKIITAAKAAEFVKDGDVLLIGGFLGVGAPHPIIEELLKTDKKDFTIVGNDTCYVDFGVGKLVVNKQVKGVITSHIGTNKETIRQMNAGETNVELVPQGTLAERIRAAGYGLGGVLTPTGVGTEVEEGKQVIEIKGVKYLLEEALRGDVSLIYATKVDKAGNCWFHGSTRNFNTVMAGASEITIVCADEIVEVGEIPQDNMHIPGVLVNYIVDGGKQ